MEHSLKKHSFPIPFWINEWISLLSLLGLFVGFVCSRAVLSISVITLFLAALHPVVIGSVFRNWKQSLFAKFCALFFGVYLLSGLWSSNTGEWFESTLMKVPFVLLPIGFFGAPLHKERFFRIFVGGVVVLQLAVIAYSVSCLLTNPQVLIDGYNYSKPLPTTKYGDHIRFSLSLVLSIVVMMYLLFNPIKYPLHKFLKGVFYLAIPTFILFIHLLAAKSGIVTLYIGLFLLTINWLSRKNKKLALAVLLGLIALPFLAYFSMPTFKKKVHYVRYEINHYLEHKHFDYTLSDAGRMITYEIGLNAIKENPWRGVGAGDIMQEMNKGYEKFYPEVSIHERYGPINQFLYTILAVGIPLGMVTVGMLLSLFMQKSQGRRFVIITGWLLLFAVSVESMLEVQFGVFIFLMYPLLWLSRFKFHLPSL